jgi:hypothetical protein
MNAHPRSRWRPAVLVVVAVSLALLMAALFSGFGHRGTKQPSLLGFSLVADGAAADITPTITNSQATSLALGALAQDRTGFQNYRLDSAAYISGLRQVIDHAGRLWFKTSDPENDHAMFFTAPGQAGWKYVSALVLVNGDNGKIEGYQVRYANSASEVMP